jgi:hypothetical protein
MSGPGNLGRPQFEKRGAFRPGSIERLARHHTCLCLDIASPAANPPVALSSSPAELRERLLNIARNWTECATREPLASDARRTGLLRTGLRGLSLVKGEEGYRAPGMARWLFYWCALSPPRIACGRRLIRVDQWPTTPATIQLSPPCP